MVPPPSVKAILLGLALSSAAEERASGRPGPSPYLPRQQLIAPCLAPSPAPGEFFSGPVLEVIDERTLCVAQGPTPDQWIRVEILEAPPGGRSLLMAAAFAKRATCVTRRLLDDGVAADCRIEGVPLLDLLSDPAVEAAARDWR